MTRLLEQLVAFVIVVFAAFGRRRHGVVAAPATGGSGAGTSGAASADGAAAPARNGPRSRYGAHPLHLVGHLLVFALIAYAAVQLSGAREAGNVLAWFIAAVLFHDAVLWPLYSLADGAGRLALRRSTNVVRIPLGLSLLLLLVFSGTILGKGSANYERVSTVPYEGYVTRWLVVSAALFALSGLAWLLSRRAGRSAGPRPGP